MTDSVSKEKMENHNIEVAKRWEKNRMRLKVEVDDGWRVRDDGWADGKGGVDWGVEGGCGGGIEAGGGIGGQVVCECELEKKEKKVVQK